MATGEPNQEFISTGYVVAKQTRLPIGHYPELKGKPIVSISYDLTGVLPDPLCFNAEIGEGERQMVHEMGLADDRLDDFRTWFLDREKEKKVVWPCRFKNAVVARDMLNEFFAGSSQLKELVLLGTGVHKKDAEILLDKYSAGSTGNVKPWIAECEILRQGQALDPAGTILGFEIICFDSPGGFSCSWLCNYLHKDAYEKFRIETGRFGLVERLADARKIADYCNLPDTETEPGLWIPVVIARY